MCSASPRDEGASHHYSLPGRWAALPDSELLRAALCSAIPDALEGPTWTTAPYRETAEEIIAYREEGIITVGMEASAIFTIGAALDVQTSSVFCVSDVLHGEEWEPHFQSPELQDTLWRLSEVVESMLTSDRPRPLTSS